MTAKLLENVSCGLQRAEEEMNRTDGRWGFSGLYRSCSSQILTSQSLWVKKETRNTKGHFHNCSSMLWCPWPMHGLGHSPSTTMGLSPPQDHKYHQKPRDSLSKQFCAIYVTFTHPKAGQKFNYGGNFREGRDVGVSKSLTRIKASLFPSRRLRCLVQNWRDRRWLPVFHS